MKARIRWKDVWTKKHHQKTFDVDKNEPNYIAHQALKAHYIGLHDYIVDIKCGRYLYMDYGYLEKPWWED